MKLWQKNITALQEVENFTVGNDRDFDVLLAPYDVIGSIAHASMLASVNLLSSKEAKALIDELKNIYTLTQQPNFHIPAEAEDIHSYIELLLTQKLGNTGKKIHTARSRNDQVLVDVKLFLRNEIVKLTNKIYNFFLLLQQKSEENKNHLLAGYTHLQIAMPSSFGLWLGAYAESLADDTISLKAAYDVVNKNPLGSAAGYGSSFPINRSFTTQLLGFESLHYNVVYAQMSRGKTERMVAQALANIADTLAKLSMDVTLFVSQNFNFISFPDELTTGSSIMPHKKNPDVFELIRSHCNTIKAIPYQISLITTNLPSGYHRDMQLLKQILFPAFTTLHQCIDMATLMFNNLTVNKHILQDEKYKYLFSVEEVNKLVLQGIPFRDAYQQIGKAIEENNYTYSTTVNHTHEGSIGNLCNEFVKQEMDKTIASFNFNKVEEAIQRLIE
jgi:argininosuccinate lyase